jgi:hypothetical protein
LPQQQAGRHEHQVDQQRHGESGLMRRAGPGRGGLTPPFCGC